MIGTEQNTCCHCQKVKIVKEYMIIDRNGKTSIAKLCDSCWDMALADCCSSEGTLHGIERI